MSRANECPRCGATVSPFAAGCSICGADLDRLRRGRRRAGFQLGVRAPSDLGVPVESAVLTLLMVVVALFAPLYGMVLAAVVFFDRRRRGDRTMCALAVACFALALASMLVPGIPYGQLPPVASGS